MKKALLSTCVILALAGTATVFAQNRPGEIVGTPENTTSENLMKRTVVPPSPPVVYAPGQRMQPMARATTFSRDRDKMIALYKDLLGLNQLMDNYWKGVGINRIKNTEGLEQRAAIFMAGLSNSGNLGIYQLYFEKLKIPPPNTSTTVRAGEAAVVFATKDINRIYEGVKKLNLVVLSPPVALVNDPNMKQQQMELLFRDPDGTLVNIIQAGVPK